MTSRCDTQSLATVWLGKDEPISRAQPIEAKTPGLGGGKRRGCPSIGCNLSHFTLMKPLLPSSRGKPFRSKLEPFAEIIRELRRKRNSYQEIRDTLREEHGISASRSTIFSFVKVRSKRRKFYAMAEGMAPVGQTPARHSSDAIEALRRKPVPKPQNKIFEFDENKPLTLIQK